MLFLFNRGFEEKSGANLTGTIPIYPACPTVPCEILLRRSRQGISPG